MRVEIFTVDTVVVVEKYWILDKCTGRIVNFLTNYRLWYFSVCVTVPDP